MKTCSVCNSEKENNRFIRGNVKPVCKICQSVRKKEYHKQYRQNNKVTILSRNKVYKQKLRLNNPSFRLSNNCSRMINLALNGRKEHYSIWEFLPYTIIGELKLHIESQFDESMNWDNYGSYWHLDHILPQSSFPYTNMCDDNFQKCWALDNLQPLEAIKNIKKSNKVFDEIK